MTMTQEEFHAARRMWATNGGTILVAQAGDPRSHMEWLHYVLDSWDNAFTTVRDYTRGYVYKDRLVAYKGEDFSHFVDHQVVFSVVELLLPVYGFEFVGLGATPGENQPWEPHVLHSVSKYMADVARMKEQQ